MTKILILLVFGLLCEAVGVVYLNQGLRQVGEVRQVTVAEVLRVVKGAATNPRVLLGMVFETLFFGTLVTMMSKGRDISFIWPLTALGFVFTTAAAQFILREQVSWLRWAGVFLIMLGAGVISYTEKIKETTPTPPAVAPGN